MKENCERIKISIFVKNELVFESEEANINVLGGLFISNEETYRILLLSLPKKVREVIQLDAHRIVDIDTVDEALKICPESTNLQVLRVIANQKRMIKLEATTSSYSQFVVDTKETVLFNFRAPIRLNEYQLHIDKYQGPPEQLEQYKINLLERGYKDEEEISGDFGKALRPVDQQEPFPGGTISVSDNFEVYINPVETTEAEKVKNVGHELFGHIYFYLIGKDPRRFGATGRLDDNRELELFISAREQEAIKNYEN